MVNKHTIVLMQPSHNRASRTFMDYESVSQALDGICGLYERKLKEINPAIRNITYDISDLYNFIDGLADLSALVYNPSIQAYLPYDREWIKEDVSAPKENGGLTTTQVGFQVDSNAKSNRIV